MKKILYLIFAFVFILIPFNTNALSKDYIDKVHDIVGKDVEDDKINIYFFNRDGCPHCAKEEKFFEKLKEKYENINVYSFEVSKNGDNSNYLYEVRNIFKEKSNGVPYTVIGDKAFLGYNEYIGNKIEQTIQDYLEIKKESEKDKNTIKLPILGEKDVRDVSIPLVAVILGLIDGFNPCAMWVLLFLINMFFGMKNKKKMFLYGYTYLCLE